MLIPNTLEVVTTETRKRILSQISLSRKAGMAIFGFEKLKSVLISQKIALLIQATDGSDREKKRMPVNNCSKILNDCLTSSELGKIFGREKVIHCGILRSGFVENIIFNANRLNNLKNPVPQYGNAELSSLDTKFYRKLSGKNNE